MNDSTKALIISLIAVSAAAAQGTKGDAPGQAPAPATAQAPAPALAQAPSYTDSQLLEEFGWFFGKKTGLADLGFTQTEADAIARGVLEALNGKESPYQPQKIGPAMDEFIQKKQTALLQSLRAKNLGEATAFFAKLKANKDVVELPDGLRYEILKPGDGIPPKPTDTVRVNYTGTLLNGNVFDSSTQRGQPAEFELSKVIPGWTEGLQKTSKGGKIKLYVPPQLGYGDDGRPGIPPGSVLIFEVELLDVRAPAPTAAPAK
ncbi:MAG TPA: FKBP-type peptidyl-prolyl cis-trans isomerase [Opitutaceae bacterium]|nr:FKBP-type peptidyl-prolyl cis-trans isomerase [Opitutaceae bacterium]